MEKTINYDAGLSFNPLEVIKERLSVSRSVQDELLFKIVESYQDANVADWYYSKDCFGWDYLSDQSDTKKLVRFKKDLSIRVDGLADVIYSIETKEKIIPLLYELVEKRKKFLVDKELGIFNQETHQEAQTEGSFPFRYFMLISFGLALGFLLGLAF